MAVILVVNRAVLAIGANLPSFQSNVLDLDAKVGAAQRSSKGYPTEEVFLHDTKRSGTKVFELSENYY